MKKQIKKNMKVSQKGITLIALVITIIVILILAGVTINLVLGDDGIIERAQQSGETYKEKEEIEIIQLAYAGIYLEEKYGNGVETGEFKTELEKAFPEKVVTVEGNKVTIGENTYKIGEKGEVSKVEMFEFTIDGESYTAEKGMTWAKWVFSEYDKEPYVDTCYGLGSDGVIWLYDSVHGCTNIVFMCENCIGNESIKYDSEINPSPQCPAGCGSSAFYGSCGSETDEMFEEYVGTIIYK